MKKGIAALALLLFFIFLLYNTRSYVEDTDTPGDTYYVSPHGSDNNTGSKSSPFRTIGKAASMVIAGDTVIVRGGSYNETVKMESDGMPSAKITFKAYPGEKPRLDGGTARNSAVVFDGRDYIRFEGFEVTGYTGHALDAGSCGHGGSIGIEVVESDIHDCGRWIPGDHSAGFYSNHGRGNKILRCTIARISGFGVFSNSEATTIKGNDISYPGIDNIYVSSQDYTLIENNYLHHNLEPVNEDEHADLIQFAAKQSGARPHSRTIIRNNVFAYGYARGQYVIVENHGDVQIYNNLMHGGAQGGIFLKGSPDCMVFNNTILDTTYKAIAVYRGSINGVANPYPSSNASIYNNIILRDAGSDIFADHSDGSSYKWVSNITSGDPRFMDRANNDFRLAASSPAKDKGYANTDSRLPYPNTDIEGRSRVVNNVIDIGAFEYVPTKAGGFGNTNHSMSPQGTAVTTAPQGR